MTRIRSTWNSKPGLSREAAVSRKADIFTMNQEHPQPSPVDYENGDPDSWGETPTTNQNVAGDYDGDHVRRNEVGLPEFREDTFKHKDSDKWGGPGKYDNQRMAAERKASLCERIARATLRTSDESLIKAQATDLMALPPKALVATINRLNGLSPASLPKEIRYRRALACAKLAYNMLGDTATENQVEQAGTILASLDDVVLKALLKVASQVKVAEDVIDLDSPEYDPDEPSEGDKPEVETACEACPPAPPAPPAEETPAPAPVAEGVPASLLDLFTTPDQVPAPEATTSSNTEGDEGDEGDEGAFFEEEEEESVACEAADLRSLFADDPEVQAQNEIRASSEAGYQVMPAVRTASTGARKLGAVTRKSDSKDDLAGLWD